MTRKVEISARTIVFTAFFVLGLWFLYMVRSILVMLFASFVLMTAINPLVKKAKKIKIPTILTIFVIYAAILTLLATAVASLIPAVMQQTRGLVNQLPKIATQLDNLYNIRVDSSFISTHFSSVPSNILKVAAGAFANIINILAIFFITYYLILEREHLHKYLVRFFGNDGAEKRAEMFVKELEDRIGGWIRGELILMLIIGATTYIGLLLLNVPYALPLGIIAGLLELIPNVGPTIAAIPAIIVGLSISPVTALGVTAFAILIQQLENNLIVPQVMKRTIGTKPLVTIVVLFTGFTLAGVLGAILAMPIYLSLATIVKHIG